MHLSVMYPLSCEYMCVPVSMQNRERRLGGFYPVNDVKPTEVDGGGVGS